MNGHNLEAFDESINMSSDSFLLQCFSLVVPILFVKIIPILVTSVPMIALMVKVNVFLNKRRISRPFPANRLQEGLPKCELKWPYVVFTSVLIIHWKIDSKVVLAAYPLLRFPLPLRCRLDLPLRGWLQSIHCRHYRRPTLHELRLQFLLLLAIQAHREILV